MGRNYKNFVYRKDQKFIYPTSDWGFKYLLGTEENKSLLLGILRELLPELDIEDIHYLPKDISIKVGKMKDAYFDVYAKLSDGSRVVIEMQNYVRATFIDRSLVYSASAILEHFTNSLTKDYHIGKTIYIAFTGDPVYPEVEHTPVRIGLCDLDSVCTIQLNDKLLQIFIELPKFAGSLKGIKKDTPFVEKLSYVLMEMADCDEVPDNLDDEVLEALFKTGYIQTMEPDVKNNYMLSVMGQFEYDAYLYEARQEGLAEGIAEGKVVGLAEGRTEGRAEGRVEGLAEGKAEGLAEGKIEGKAEGRKEAIDEIVQSMIANGISPELISKITGKPENELKHK